MPGLGFTTSSSPLTHSVAAKSRGLSPGVSNPTSSAPATSNACPVGNGDVGTEKPKLDPSDPRVRKLVYSMYRDMLTSRNSEANDIISKKDPAKVTQDSGVLPILESIIIKQRSAQGGGGDSSAGPTLPPTCEGQAESGTSNGTSTMSPPPPPPPMMPGTLPAVRLSSEIGPRDKGPPAALAGAMMKDKKPFTYTPGGIDLSEIRSPRMAKRIQMNAAAEGVTNTPTTPSTSGMNQERAPLPPAALAAMQPQMAIPVFPQGNINAVQLNRSHKPADYSENMPPPPPPPMMMSAPAVRPQMSTQPTLQPMRQISPPLPKSPPPPSVRTPPSPPERAATSKSPIPSSPRSPVPMAPRSPVQMSPRSPIPVMDSYLGNSRPNSQTSNIEERRSPLGRKSPAMVESGVGTGSLFIPHIQQASPQYQPQAPPPPPPAGPRSPLSTYVPPSSRPGGQSKAQAVSQNIGTLYIPPIGPRVDDNSSNGNVQGRPPQIVQPGLFSPQSASATPTAPQLNKAPVPWMNSYNRIQNQQSDSPPYVHPGFFMPPWGPPPGAGPGGPRTIPIMMQRESDQPDGSGAQMTGAVTDSRRSSSASSSASGSRTPSQAAAHLGRVIPIQIEREETGRAKGAKIIPIKVEGRPSRMTTPTTPMTPSVMMNPMRRVVPTYNSPVGLYSNQNVQDARQAAEAAAGVDRMNIGCESPRTEPMQSKSLRVIQQAAENELKRIEQEQDPLLSLDLTEDDRHLMNLFKSQVDEGSSLHHTAEPRFMGGHIPSKAFRALQTALPVSPGAQDQPPPRFPAAQGGPVTHHIPIRQVAQSPAPQSQPSEIQLNSQGLSSVPASEQVVQQEPRKYMGSNIPSRSFKILQAMTSEDGQPAVVGSADETASSSSDNNFIADSYSDDYYDDNSSVPHLSQENVPDSSLSSSMSSLDSYPFFFPGLSEGGNGGGSLITDPYGNPIVHNDKNHDSSNYDPESWQNFWPDSVDQGWDPYTYMWYYWWYYASCYWAGYDMTGYEYPPGWDPNYPAYCPPEMFADYSTDHTTAPSADEGDDHQDMLSSESASSTPALSADLHSSLQEAQGYYYDSSQEEESNQDRERIHFTCKDNTGNNNGGGNGRVTKSSDGLPRIVIEDEDCSNRYAEEASSEGNLFRRSSPRAVDSITDKGRRNNDSSNSKAPTTTISNALTECNQKPGNPATLPCKKKMNDCDDGSAARKMWNKGDSDNGDEEDGRRKKDDTHVVDKNDERSDSSASSSDDEYESCCEDPETKVIERETNNSSNFNGNNNSKPFVTTTSQNFGLTADAAELSQSLKERKFELHDNYNSEINPNDDDDPVVDGAATTSTYAGKKDEKKKESNNNINGALEENEGDEDEEEKTDPGADEDNEDDDYGGRTAIVEEPETPSSADDSDVATLVNEQQHQRSGKSSTASFYDGGLSIEEYHSESSDSAVFDYGPKKNRLSTIDEITESRASSSLWSCESNSVAARNLSTAMMTTGASADFDSGANKNNNNNSNSLNEDNLVGRQNNNNHNTGDGLESEDSEESSDELSSVSVIENKSDATRGTTESKREDETTSTSEEHSDDSSSENEDNDEGDYDDDDDEVEGADTAVTVRLPLKLCFGKTKSYKDITTVMVGDSEIEEVHSSSSPQVSTKEIDRVPSTNDDGCGNNDRNETDNEDEPVVSFTISLSRQTSREDDESNENESSGGKHAGEMVHAGQTETEPGNKNDDPVDIDFWAEITKDSDEEDESCGPREVVAAAAEEEETVVISEAKSNQGNKEDYWEEADVGFWGIIMKDRSTSDFTRRVRHHQRNGSVQMDEDDENDDQNQQHWDPQESIDYKWEKDFNFWEKSSRTIETRRFSDFEITEDYESDSGLKPVVMRKERVKRHHHKRHSIPGPSSSWDRSSLPPRPTPKQSTLAGKASSSSKTSGGAVPVSNNNEQEIKDADKWSGKFVKSGEPSQKKEERQQETKISSGRQTSSDTYQDDTESWWSYWDDVSSTTKKNEDDEKEKVKNNEGDEADDDEEEDQQPYKTNDEEEVESGGGGVTLQRENNRSDFDDTVEQKEEGSSDISVEIKLSEAGAQRHSGTGESTGGEDDYQSFAWSGSFQQASRTEAKGTAGFSSFEDDESKKRSGAERKRSLNHSCQSDATTVTTDNEDYSSSPEIKSTSLLFPSMPGGRSQEMEKLAQHNPTNNNNNINSASISDENSDESSSRSSGTTIGRQDKAEIKTQDSPPDNNNGHTIVIPPTAVTADTHDEEDIMEADNDNGCEVGHLKGRASPSLEDSSIPIPVSNERNVEIQHEHGERIKLRQHHFHHCQEESLHHLHHHSTATTTASTAAINTTSASACTCLMGDRIARAENLLWRIERFLHESLSLGSEDDSGVMTDLSRQISDVDTDVDNDLNETEFLLTAAAVAKERRGVAFSTNNTGNNNNDHGGSVATSGNKDTPATEHIESCNFAETISSTDTPVIQSSKETASSSSSNPPHPPQVTKRPRPKSDIFLESTFLSKVEAEEAIVSSTTTATSATVEESSTGVKMRSASERRALRYQRAKTHSRLFQLLQDECGRDEEQEEFDYDSDVGTLTGFKQATTTNINNINAGTGADCQINADTSGTMSGLHHHLHNRSASCINVMDDDAGGGGGNNECSSSTATTATSPTRMNDAQARRSRLLPLPIKNLLASSLSLDSNSSPSGSSGVLSPTSPVNRDQLLADIINEFHLRNQASTMRAQNQRRISSSFPSKIFKLLQHEFGEEFYQTFDCCGGGDGGNRSSSSVGEDSLISPCMSTNFCVNEHPAGSSSPSPGASFPLVHECTIHKSDSMKEFEEATNRILTNLMLRNTTSMMSSSAKQKPSSTSESPSLSTATASSMMSSQLLQDDSKNSSVDFLEVPMRRKKANLNRDPRSPKCTKKS